jgi:hypothetical protein
MRPDDLTRVQLEALEAKLPLLLQLTAHFVPFSRQDLLVDHRCYLLRKVSRRYARGIVPILGIGANGAPC